MSRSTLALGGAASVFLAACATSDRVTRSDVLPDAPSHTIAADGTCWSRETTPAVYEQVMGEVQVVQAEIAEDGAVLRPPIYRRALVPRIVTPRRDMRFEVPCAHLMTPELIGSVQRALSVRGYYSGPITGTLDAATTQAIRTFQTERGLDSGQLSLATAKDLGLVAVDRADL